MPRTAVAFQYPITPRQARCLFTRLVVETLTWGYAQARETGSPLYGCEFAHDEGTIKSPRRVRKAGMVFEAGDAVHGNSGKFRSLHHDGRALDVLIYRNGIYLADGNDPAYRALGEHFAGLHPLASWGGDFGDANHLSLRDGARR